MNKHIGLVVEQCLKESQVLRDDDFLLWLWVLERLWNVKIEDSIPVELARMYPFGTVVRHRANIQNKWGMYPASDKVRCKRIVAKKKWYSFLLA
jgi:hypothetical protein